MKRAIQIAILLLLPLALASAQEENRLRLRELTVSGLSGLSMAEQRDLTGLEEGSQYTDTELDAARDTVIVRLASLNDYPFATLDSFILDTLAGNRAVNLQVSIDPGPELWVRSVELTGPLAGQEERLRGAIRTEPGARLRNAQWERDMQRAVEVLREQGYPFAKVETGKLRPNFIGDTVYVDLALNVLPGTNVSIEHVEFAGLERTKPRTARRAAYLREQPYHPAAVERARRRLLRTEWFADVSRGEVFRDREGRYGVLFEVREQPTSSVSGALGYAADDEGVAGALDATLANLFGDGRAFDLHWRRDSEDSRAFSVQYLEPYLFGLPLDATVHLSQEVRDSQYVAVEFGGGLSARIADEWTVSGTLRQRAITADSLAENADTSDYSLVGAGLALAYDTRDRRSNPRRGAYAKLGSERLFLDGTRTEVLTGGSRQKELAGTYRNTVDVELAVPLRNEWVGFMALHGVDLAVDRDETPPFAEWPQLGGAATVRGFAERSLIAPSAGWGTMELRYLLGPRSRAYALGDAVALGAVHDATRWEWSYGAGVMVDTGIGLLNVAIAVPGGEGFSAAVVHAQAVARF